jgi:hypothetical protein
MRAARFRVPRLAASARAPVAPLLPRACQPRRRIIPLSGVPGFVAAAARATPLGPARQGAPSAVAPRAVADEAPERREVAAELKDGHLRSPAAVADVYTAIEASIDETADMAVDAADDAAAPNRPSNRLSSLPSTRPRRTGRRSGRRIRPRRSTARARGARGVAASPCVDRFASAGRLRCNSGNLCVYGADSAKNNNAAVDAAVDEAIDATVDATADETVDATAEPATDAAVESGVVRARRARAARAASPSIENTQKDNKGNLFCIRREKAHNDGRRRRRRQI